MSTKRPAASPAASPSKASFNAKRSRTQYDYCDDDDVESYTEEQWSDADMDSPSRMSLDDSDDSIERFMPGPADVDTYDYCRPKYSKDRKVTEVSTWRKRPIHHASAVVKEDNSD